MKTPIEEIQGKRFSSYTDALSAIAGALVKQFDIPADQLIQVRLAVYEAWRVGRRTITTDDWCSF